MTESLRIPQPAVESLESLQGRVLAMLRPTSSLTTALHSVLMSDQDENVSTLALYLTVNDRPTAYTFETLCTVVVSIDDTRPIRDANYEAWSKLAAWVERDYKARQRGA